MRFKERIILTITDGAIGVIVTYLKKKIREPHKTTQYDVLCNLRGRIVELEVRQKVINKKNPTLNPKTRPLFETMNDAKARAMNAPAPKYVIPGLIREGEICNIMAKQKVGKSITAFQIAYECAYGSKSSLVPSNGELCSPQEVFYYDAEQSDYDILERYRNIDAGKIHKSSQRIFEKPEDLLDHIQGSIDEVKSNALVIIDNITAICPVVFNGKAIRTFIGKIKDAQEEFRTKDHELTVIIVHHAKTNKDEISGFKEWAGLTTKTISLKVANGAEHSIKLSVQDARGKCELLADDEEFLLRMEEIPYPHFEFVRRVGGDDCMSGKESNKPTNTPKWALNEEEKKYVDERYDPGIYGYGLLAKDILERRGIVATKSNIAKVKTEVGRSIKGKNKKVAQE